MSTKLNVIADQEGAPSRKWYRKGLRFECTECGQCCTGVPGYTWVSPEEAQAIADHLGISVEVFAEAYMRRAANGRMALKELKSSYACIFLDGKRCSIYPVRPKQCSTFPWWPEVLESREAWQEAARRCEGMNDDAPLIPAEEIERQLHTP